jgi:hypothetical protein
MAREGERVSMQPAGTVALVKTETNQGDAHQNLRL